MPTLVWVRRPKSGTDTAAGGDSANRSRREKAVPDGVVFAAAAAAAPAAAVPDAVSVSVRDPVQVALPEVEMKKKRKKSPAKEIAAAKKKSKAASERDLPKGVTKRPSGNFASSIWWGGMQHYIGTFDTTEHASAACLSVKKDLDDAELSTGSADEVIVMFIAAQKKAVKAFGGCIPKKKRAKTTSERELPRGVSKLPSGKFQCVTFWGGKSRRIGTFESPEQASVAYVSVREDIDDAKLSAVGADEVDAILQLRKKPPRKHLNRTKK